MKSMYNSNKKQLTLMVFLFTIIITNAQDIHFTFANAQNTIDHGEYYYEADVMIEASEAFKLGSGQIYLTYNTEAFGDNVSKHSGIQYEYEPGYILGESYVLSAYKSFTQNDNTENRVSFTFQQGVSAESITKENVTTTAKPLFHIKLRYLDVTKNPMIAFEEGKVFQDQFFTACGSMLKSGAKAGFPDCANLPGKQLVNDTYDSTGAALQTLSTDDEALDTISLYPNPAANFFMVKGLDVPNATISISDLNGKLIKSLPDHNLDKNITISDLQTGVYLVQVSTNQVQKIYKLIRE